MNMSDVIGEDVKVFKQIVNDLVEASGASIDTVVNKLLKTKYSYLVQEASFAEIGYIFGVTKQAAESMMKRTIGKKQLPTNGRTKAQMPSSGGSLQNYKTKAHPKLISLMKYIEDFDMQTINKTTGVNND